MIRRLVRVALPAWPWLAASLLARVAGLAAGVALLALPAWGVVAAAGGDDVDLLALSVVLVALAAAKGVLRYLEQFFGHRAAFDLIADMRLRLYDAIVPLAPGELESDSGMLTSIAARDVDRVEVFFAHTIVPAIAAVVVPGAVTAWALLSGPVEGIVVLGAFLVGGVVIPLLGRRVSGRAARGLLTERAAIAQHVAEDVAARTEIRTLRAEETRLSALDALSVRAGRHLRASGIVQAGRSLAGLLWPSAAVIALLAFGTASAEERIVLAAAVVGAAPALTAVEAFARSLPLALAAARRYLGVLDRVPAVSDPVSPSDLPRGPLSVRVEDVRFRYRGAEAPVLEDVTLEVPARGRLALLGPSGSGKSTIAALLLRAHDPERGRVLVGGVDVRDLALGDLRRAVALVEQRTVLVSGSVLDNLRLGNPRLSEDEAWSALEEASLADDVRAHPDGLAVRLSEDGLSLSGGQRQRLGLARALARRPQVLVLDEATSHQDALTQRAIRRAIAARPDLTAIVIAHRPDAVAGIERVVRL